MSLSSSHPCDSVFDAILQRRSVRAFADPATQPVTREQMLSVLDAGRWAPSGLNNQPYRFVALDAVDPRTPRLAERTKYGAIVRGAGALAVVLLHRESMYNAAKDHQGAGACIQNMLLAAHGLGLGAVWLGEILNDADGVLVDLGLSPEDYELQAVIAMGHPHPEGRGVKPPKRMDLSDYMAEPIAEDF